jgi:hypothetical protein
MSEIAIFRQVVRALRRDLPHHSAAVAAAPAAMGATGLGSAEEGALRVHNHVGGGT